MRDVITSAETFPRGVAAERADSVCSQRAVADAPAPPVEEQPEGAALSAEQLEAIAIARRRGRTINRAAGVAAFSGRTMAIFAAISLLSGLFSLPALFLGLGMSVVAFVELRGSKALRAFDLGAPRRLALNQLALAILVTAYAAWSIAQSLVGPGPYDEYLAAGGRLAETLAPIDRMTRTVTIGFYAALIGGTVIAQGCAAVYYFSRRRHMLAYVRSTPKWVIETLRAASG